MGSISVTAESIASFPLTSDLDVRVARCAAESANDERRAFAMPH
jgi:hypothetical protein